MMTAEEALAIFEVKLAKLRREHNGTYSAEIAALNFPAPIDFDALFAREGKETWLVENLWPDGKQIHIHAAHKTGKSLIALFVACSLASGRDPVTGLTIEPVRIAYMDFEMTEEDLAERIESMGFTSAQLSGKLLYWLYPPLAKLDTEAGGKRLVEIVSVYQCQAVIIDTLSRVVVGDESSNDTYIRFYNWCGMLLKNAGIALLRLDHEGHEKGRSRGASAKADDVDIVWQLVKTDEGLSFIRTMSRVNWIPERVQFRMTDEPTLRFDQINESWPMNTREKADQLDAVKAPIDISKRQAQNLLKAANIIPGKEATLLAAIRYRKQRENREWNL